MTPLYPDSMPAAIVTELGSCLVYVHVVAGSPHGTNGAFTIRALYITWCIAGTDVSIWYLTSRPGWVVSVFAVRKLRDSMFGSL